MTAVSAPSEAVEAGVVLWLDGPAVRYRAPVGVMGTGLRERLVAHRSGVVALLLAGACLPAKLVSWPDEPRHRFEERAGTLEFEGGLVREVAEFEAERLERVAYTLAFIARHALVAEPVAGAVACDRPGGGPYWRP